MSSVPAWKDAALALAPIAGSRLPLFRHDEEAYAVFYAPGCLCVAPRAEADLFEAGLVGGRGSGWAARLRQRAEQARARAAATREAPFRPECLTLYLHDECSLRCTYCYVDPRPPSAAAPRAASHLDPASVAAAADLVAANCRAEGLPFFVGFHGGGEPTLHRGQAEALLALVRRAAQEHGVAPHLYVATNGALSEGKARWLARNFTHVGLSCDGPADIHDAQRPDARGRGTLHLVERTARLLREEGVAFRVRTTITPASLRRQAEIAAHLCQHLAPDEIHFEPVYGAGTDPWAGPEAKASARAWADGFLEARAVAAGYGLPLHTSGSRPAEIHGPHCQVLRQVLNLVPGEGLATVCFKTADAARARRLGVVVGALQPRTGRFEIDAARVDALRRQLAALPTRCEDCFNRFHCARECPDGCPLEAGRGSALVAAPAPAASPAQGPVPGAVLSNSPVPGFRCQAQRLLTARILAQKAADLWAEVSAGEGRGAHGTTVL